MKVVILRPNNGESSLKVKPPQFLAFHVNLVTPVHPLKAPLPIDVTPVPMLTEVNPEQL